METALSRDQVRRVDSLAINRLGIPGPVLMENAGRNAAAIIHDTYGPTGRAIIVCGPGNNGGDGCVIARHLHNLGWAVELMMTGDESKMTDDAKGNFQIVRAMKLPARIAPDASTQRAFVETIQSDDVVVDALLGTGFRGEVRSPTAELIAIINATARKAVVAIDVPSGLDCDTGEPSNATMRADLTVTFVASKIGFAQEAAGPYVGRVEVVEIGAPPELVAEAIAALPVR